MLNSWWTVAPELLFKSTAVLVMACAASLLAFRASAAARHAIWVLALSSLLLLPGLGALLPAWRPARLSRSSVSVSTTREIVHGIAPVRESSPQQEPARTKLPQQVT